MSNGARGGSNNADDAPTVLNPRHFSCQSLNELELKLFPLDEGWRFNITVPEDDEDDTYAAMISTLSTALSKERVHLKVLSLAKIHNLKQELSTKQENDLAFAEAQRPRCMRWTADEMPTRLSHRSLELMEFLFALKQEQAKAAKTMAWVEHALRLAKLVMKPASFAALQDHTEQLLSLERDRPFQDSLEGLTVASITDELFGQLQAPPPESVLLGALNLFKEKCIPSTLMVYVETVDGQNVQREILKHEKMHQQKPSLIVVPVFHEHLFVIVGNMTKDVRCVTTSTVPLPNSVRQLGGLLIEQMRPVADVKLPKKPREIRLTKQQPALFDHTIVVLNGIERMCTPKPHIQWQANTAAAHRLLLGAQLAMHKLNTYSPLSSTGSSPSDFAATPSPGRGLHTSFFAQDDDANGTAGAAQSSLDGRGRRGQVIDDGIDNGEEEDGPPARHIRERNNPRRARGRNKPHADNKRGPVATAPGAADRAGSGSTDTTVSIETVARAPMQRRIPPALGTTASATSTSTPTDTTCSPVGGTANPVTPKRKAAARGLLELGGTFDAAPGDVTFSNGSVPPQPKHRLRTRTEVGGGSVASGQSSSLLEPSRHNNEQLVDAFMQSALASDTPPSTQAATATTTTTTLPSVVASVSESQTTQAQPAVTADPRNSPKAHEHATEPVDGQQQQELMNDVRKFLMNAETAGLLDSTLDLADTLPTELSADLANPGTQRATQVGTGASAAGGVSGTTQRAVAVGRLLHHPCSALHRLIDFSRLEGTQPRGVAAYARRALGVHLSVAEARLVQEGFLRDIRDGNQHGHSPARVACAQREHRDRVDVVRVGLQCFRKLDHVLAPLLAAVDKAALTEEQLHALQTKLSTVIEESARETHGHGRGSNPFSMHARVSVAPSAYDTSAQPKGDGMGASGTPAFPVPSTSVARASAALLPAFTASDILGSLDTSTPAASAAMKSSSQRVQDNTNRGPRANGLDGLLSSFGAAVMPENDDSGSDGGGGNGNNSEADEEVPNLVGGVAAASAGHPAEHPQFPAPRKDLQRQQGPVPSFGGRLSAVPDVVSEFMQAACGTDTSAIEPSVTMQGNDAHHRQQQQQQQQQHGWGFGTSLPEAGAPRGSGQRKTNRKSKTRNRRSGAVDQEEETIAGFAQGSAASKGLFGGGGTHEQFVLNGMQDVAANFLQCQAQTHELPQLPQLPSTQEKRGQQGKGKSARGEAGNKQEGQPQQKRAKRAKSNKAKATSAKAAGTAKRVTDVRREDCIVQWRVKWKQRGKRGDRGRGGGRGRGRRGTR